MWDPDKVAPPSGDVYERERKAADGAARLGAWMVGFAVAAMVVWFQRHMGL